MKKLLFALLLCSLSFSAHADKQADRKAFIKDLIKQGYIQKVDDSGSLPHLWVKPRFYSLNFDTKAQMVNVVYAYYITANPNAVMVVLRDSKTGKEIGMYAPLYGGLKLN